MEIHKLIQGTPTWHKHRAVHYNASDAAAMLGISPYKSRTQLLHEYHVGVAIEPDEQTLARYAAGHRFEALARPLAELIVKKKLYPVVGSSVDNKLAASFDGLTRKGDVVWEHKSQNEEIMKARDSRDLAEYLRAQMEHQLIVSGAERCLFSATKWDNSKLVSEVHHFYYPDIDLRKRIIRGWKQFEEDLKNYTPKDIMETPKAAPIMQLPALVVKLSGKVLSTNLPAFKQAADTFVANINRVLKTDEDFANAEAMVKFLKETEEKLELAKAQAIAQTASIDELMRTVDHVQDNIRTTRLELDKLVTKEKTAKKDKIILTARELFNNYVAILEIELTPINLYAEQPNFAEVIKGKRTLTSIHSAVDDELAKAKMATNELATQLRLKLAWYKEQTKDHTLLFPDLQAIIYKDQDDFRMLVNSRITEFAKPLVLTGKTVEIPLVKLRDIPCPTKKEILSVLALHYSVSENRISTWLSTMNFPTKG